jgi:hypothetical protein
MNWEYIHPQLATMVEHKFPVDAVAACNANPDAVRAPLLAALRQVVDDPALLHDEAHDQTFVFAAYLLIQWREPAMLPLLLQIARWPEAGLESLYGDDFSATLAQGLAACGDADDVAPLLALIHDRKASQWTRSCGITALAIRVKEGELSKAIAVQHFRQIAAPFLVDLEDMLNAEHEPDEAEFETLCWLVQSVMYAAADIGASEMRAECLAWCEREYLLDLNETPASIGAMFDQPNDYAVGVHYLRDAAGFMQSWPFFQSLAQREAEQKRLAALLKTLKKQPFVHESSKTGRNDPCPCGSGKKYKKCCGLN